MHSNIVARYEQAQTFTQGISTSLLVQNDVVLPHWIEGSVCFWYVRSTKTGREFRIVNSTDTSNKVAFDHEDLARQLQNSSAQKVESFDLPIKNLVITLSPTRHHFEAFDKSWYFIDGVLSVDDSEPSNDDLFYPHSGETPSLLDCCERPVALTSPDRKKAVFARDNNLWLRDITTGKDQALTTDGTVDARYGRAPGFVTSVQASWSPDSKRVLTAKYNTQEIAARPYVSYAPADGSLNPKVNRITFPYPADESALLVTLHCIDVEGGNVQPLDYPDLHNVYLGDYHSGFFTSNLGWWSVDSRHAYFVDAPRSADSVRVIEFDADTGQKTRTLFEETSDTWIYLLSGAFDQVQILPLPESNELIWYSERSGYGQLYLYDLETGQVKRRITNGEGTVRGILDYDAKSRELLVLNSGHDKEINPYYRHIWTLNIDTGERRIISDGDFDHEVLFPVGLIVMGLREKNPSLVVHGGVNGVSPDSKLLVTTRSRVDMAPISLLIDRDGNEIMTIETADVSNLPDDWVWPESVTLKDADGTGDIYGVVFKPPGFSPDKQYPVLDYTWTMKNLVALPVGSFTLDCMFGYTYCLSAALAALGFIVVSIEGRGGMGRGVKFRDYYFDDSAGLHLMDDHAAGIRQLAERYRYMDIDKVGVVAAEQSCYALYGALHHSDLFKVAVQHPFPDPRYIDLGCNRKSTASSAPNIEDYAGKLEGKLLLIQGMLSFAAGATFRIIEAFRKENKDFDLISLPNMTHQMNAYTTRREWDYVVSQLQGIKPPKEFPLKLAEDLVTDVPFALDDDSSELFMNIFGGTSDE